MRSNIFCGIFVLLFAMACQQEAVSISEMTKDTTLQTLLVGDEGSKNDDKDTDWKGDKGMESCFHLVYPLSVTMPDGSTLSGEKEALWEDVKAWYSAHPDSKKKPSLNYPVDVHWLKDDVVKTISKMDEMTTAKKYCYGDKAGKENCFELVYPVTWTMPDGSTISMDDEKDYDAIKAWYEAHPNSKEKASLNYPVEVHWVKDDVTKTINNEDEMIKAKKDCK